MKLKVQYLDNYKWDKLFKDVENSGFDLRASINEQIKLYPNERKLIKLGIKTEIPVGYEVQIRPRSGLALKHGISVVNTPGTVDSGFRDEWKVILVNHGDRPFDINPGDRICQGVLMQVPHCDIIEVDCVNETERGVNGFGSSGVK